MSIRVMLVDDHALFCDAVSHALSREPDMEVAGACESVEQALERLSEMAPDLVLLDYDLHGRRGTEFLRAAKEKGYQGAVLIVSAGLPDYELQSCFSQGASGVFLKEKPLSHLLEAIRAVAEGRAWYDQRQLQTISQLNEPGHAVTFTGRERDILRYVVEGLSNKEIAHRLGVPETAVKAGVQRLFQKVGTRSRGSLVRVAMEKYHDYLLAPSGF
jgi:two-component system, NarL family, nitrate/nitrite response regulator NarL